MERPPQVRLSYFFFAGAFLAGAFLAGAAFFAGAFLAGAFFAGMVSLSRPGCPGAFGTFARPKPSQHSPFK